MDPIFNGCRLCLDPFEECFTTIDNPQLKDQMEKVFCFVVEPKQGYSSGVCQSCSYAISGFYQYSEKVRQNQEVLKGNVTNYDRSLDAKITLEGFEIETLSNSGQPKRTEGAYEPEDKVSGEETIPTLETMITLENVNIEMISDSGHPETVEPACETEDEASGEKSCPTLETMITLENVKIETISDLGHPETAEDASEPEDEVSGEEEVSNSSDDESYEALPKKSLTKRKSDNADEPIQNSKQTTYKSRQDRIEKDQYIKKHIRMACDLCGTSTVKFEELRSHFWKEHKRRAGYVKCCNKKLFTKSRILDHLDYHANPEVFRCEMCGSTYNEKLTLKRHMIFRHPGEDYHHHPFKCDQCPQSFEHKFSLNQHINLHVKVKCPKCKKVFARRSFLSFHLANQLCFDRKQKGIDEQRFQCASCQRWLKTEMNFRNHMNICQRKIPHIRALQCHTKTHTQGPPSVRPTAPEVPCRASATPGRLAPSDDPIIGPSEASTVPAIRPTAPEVPSRASATTTDHPTSTVPAIRPSSTPKKSRKRTDRPPNPSSAASSVRSSSELSSVELASTRRAPVRRRRRTAKRIYRSTDELVALQNSAVSIGEVPVPEGVDRINQQMFEDWITVSYRQPTTFLLLVLSHIYPQIQSLSLSNTHVGSTLLTIDTATRDYLSRLQTLYLRRSNIPLPGNWRRNDQNIYNAVKRFNDEVKKKTVEKEAII